MRDFIEFRVDQGDITTYEADVVVLKHAQAFLGADKAVAYALGKVGVSDNDLQAKPGDYRFVDSRGGIKARHALYVGVVPLLEFGYQQIGEFATTALRILSHEAPAAGRIAMTVHGVGFGLDEVEAFIAQFDGCLKAVRLGVKPADLESISIVDRNSNRVQRLRQALQERLASEHGAVPVEDEWGFRLPIRRRMGHAGAIIAQEPVLPGVAAEQKPRVFVAMPFKKELDDVFYYGILGPARAAGFVCERVDEEAFTGDILSQIKKRIEGATLVIAELTDANPNVYLEIGYAWGKGRPTVLVARTTADLRFDVSGQRCLLYERIKDLEERLSSELTKLLEKEESL